MKNKKIIVQGWGNVGSSAAYYLSKYGASIVGIIDKNGGIINENGISHNEVRQLFLEKKHNKLFSKYVIPFDVVNEKIWILNADVFIPCAASRLVTKENLNSMISSGVEQFLQVPMYLFRSEIFYSPILNWQIKKSV